jgi:hypothetical protein
LVGAELAAAVLTVSGVDRAWGYGVGLAVGAGAGAAAGYLVEQRAEQAASDVLFIAGLALVIPTLVWIGRAHEPKPTAALVVVPRRRAMAREDASRVALPRMVELQLLTVRF